MRFCQFLANTRILSMCIVLNRSQKESHLGAGGIILDDHFPIKVNESLVGEESND